MKLTNIKDRGNRRFFILLTACAALFFTLSAGGAFGVWIDPYLKKVDVKDVKSVRIVRYIFENGKWQETEVMAASYDLAGRLMQETRHDAHGVLQFEYFYTYNSKGEMVRVTGNRLRSENLIPYNYTYEYDERGNQISGIGYDERGNETSKYTAKYDAENNFLEGIEYRDGSAVSKYVAEYDKNNNMIEERKYTVYQYKNEDRYQLEFKHVFTYDGDNNLIREINYGSGEVFQFHYFYECDENGNVVKGLNYAEDGSLLGRYSAEYDENNNLTVSAHYGPSGEVVAMNRARYDKDHRLVEDIDVAGGVSKTKYLAEYDKKGNLLAESYFDQQLIGGPGVDYKYTYAYDRRNNRTEENYYVFIAEADRWKPVSRQINEITYRK